MLRVLIVEDEDLLRESYHTILSAHGYVCDAVENGKKALERCQTETYDLILLDLMMPVMSGVKFLKKFMPSAPPNTKIIVLSNLSSGSDLEQAMDLGVYKCLLKADISPGELVAAVKNELGDGAETTPQSSVA
jgi:DNA-binding response OmpR family regulator